MYKKERKNLATQLLPGYYARARRGGRGDVGGGAVWQAGNDHFPSQSFVCFRCDLCALFYSVDFNLTSAFVYWTLIFLVDSKLWR